MATAAVLCLGAILSAGSAAALRGSVPPAQGRRMPAGEGLMIG